jgi:hypothetical protein
MQSCIRIIYEIFVFEIDTISRALQLDANLMVKICWIYSSLCLFIDGEDLLDLPLFVSFYNGINYGKDVR